jgi:hypothetical protein
VKIADFDLTDWFHRLALPAILSEILSEMLSVTILAAMPVFWCFFGMI